MIKRIAFFTLCFLPQIALGIAVDFDEAATIRADKVEYDLKSETIKTTGKTEITNKSGQKMTLTDSYLTKDGKNLSGNDIEIWLGKHVYMQSENVTRNGDETIANDAIFTACKNCDSFGEAWEISSDEVTHDMSERELTFYNSVFWLYSVPVFWMPYFSMPDPGVKHKSGFLMPNLASTNKMGTQINLPVYLYLSDIHDATVTFSYLTQENPLLQLEHRFNGAHSEFRTYSSFTHNREGDNRWHIFHNDIIELGENARAKIFLARASDITYLQKYGFYDSQPYLDSGGQIELFGQTGYVVADAHVFQELRKDVQHVLNGNILPNIRGKYQTAPMFSETYASFMGDVLGISGDGVSSQRLIGEARVVSPWTLWGGNRFTASVATRYDIYNFNNTVMIDGDEYSGIKTRFLPSGYLEWGLPLFRPSENWTQILEPRARFTIMRHISNSQFALDNDSAGTLLSDTTLFSNNRFSGLDLWENGTFADYGLRWAAFNPGGHTIETFFGQTYDFTDRENTDPNSGFYNGQSDYVGRIGYNNSKWLDIYSRFRLSRENLDLRHFETNMVLGTGRNYLNIGHIWSQQFIDTQSNTESIHEFAGGVGLGLSQRWSIRLDAIYNMTEDRFQQHTGALYYEHPCYYFSFGYKRDNAIKWDYVGTTTFQFKFGISIDGQHY